MTTVDKWCATCNVKWNPVGGFYHKMGCPQYMKQESAEALDHVDYTPPDNLYDKGYKGGYNDGWNDAIEDVVKKIDDISIQKKKATSE